MFIETLNYQLYFEAMQRNQPSIELKTRNMGQTYAGTTQIC